MIKPAVTTMLGLLLAVLAAAQAAATDWAGVQLAWRNDPRPAADAPLPVDAPPSRRTSRRAQRRVIRRGDLEPIAVEPSGAPVVAPTLELAPSIPLEPAGQDVDPPPERPRTIVHADQAYGDQPRQRYDLHVPDGCSGGGLPLVAWIHGADWRTGTKSDCPIAWLVEQGFAVASIDYRTSDLAVFPAQLDDCRAALAAIHRDAETWGIDAERICVAGRGGGGTLAALIAFAPPESRPIREAATDDVDDLFDVAAVAIFDAPTHLPSLGGHHDRAGSAASRLVGGPLPEFREAAQRASPLLQISAGAPPTLIVHGGRGDGTAVDQGERLDAALRDAGVDSTVVILDVAANDLAPRRGSPAAGTLLEFLDRVVGHAAATRED